jgi:hypothetical protein
MGDDSQLENVAKIFCPLGLFAGSWWLATLLWLSFFDSVRAVDPPSFFEELKIYILSIFLFSYMFWYCRTKILWFQKNSTRIFYPILIGAILSIIYLKFFFRQG